jgi:hypothetical protein
MIAEAQALLLPRGSGDVTPALQDGIGCILALGACWHFRQPGNFDFRDSGLRSVGVSIQIIAAQ